VLCGALSATGEKLERPVSRVIVELEVMRTPGPGSVDDEQRMEGFTAVHCQLDLPSVAPMKHVLPKK
jgi:hypothetical protein